MFRYIFIFIFLEIDKFDVESWIMDYSVLRLLLLVLWHIMRIETISKIEVKHLQNCTIAAGVITVVPVIYSISKQNYSQQSFVFTVVTHCYRHHFKDGKRWSNLVYLEANRENIRKGFNNKSILIFWLKSMKMPWNFVRLNHWNPNIWKKMFKQYS